MTISRLWMPFLAATLAATPVLAEGAGAQPPSDVSVRVITGALQKCLDFLPGLELPIGWYVTFRAEYDVNGALLGSPLFVNGSDARSDRRFLVFSDRAYRTLIRCNPLKGLDETDYESWRELQLTFTPTEIRVDN